MATATDGQRDAGSRDGRMPVASPVHEVPRPDAGAGAGEGAERGRHVPKLSGLTDPDPVMISGHASHRDIAGPIRCLKDTPRQVRVLTT